MEYVGFFVADSKGYYAAEGLTVTIDEGSGATTAAKLIASGTYSIGLSTGDALVIAAEANLPIKSVAVIFQRSPVVLFALEESGIVGIRDLVGRRVGVSTGDTKYNYYTGLLNRLGIERESIDEVAVGFEVAPLLAGQVDALLGYVNVQPLLVERQGRNVTVFSFADLGMDIYSEAIIVNNDYLAAEPERVRAFVAASVKGWRYAVAQPEEAVQIFRSSHPEYDADFLAESFRRVVPLVLGPGGSLDTIGQQTRDGWVKTRDTLREFGLIKSPVPVERFYVEDVSGEEGLVD